MVVKREGIVEVGVDGKARVSEGGLDQGEQFIGQLKWYGLVNGRMGCDWKLTCGRERAVDEGDCRTMKVRGLIVVKSRMRMNVKSVSNSLF